MKRDEQLPGKGDPETQWKSIYRLGAVTAIIGLVGITVDVVIGILTGGDLSALPQTAVERFAEFSGNPMLGMYHLDLLNAMVQLILIPAFFALYAAHRHTEQAFGLLALIVFLVGSVLLVANNSALPMLELNNRFLGAVDDSQKALYAAAGEAMLATGAHGSPGIFFGFFIPNLANLMISMVMFRGGIFTKTNSWLGIIGSCLMMIYVVMVNFGTAAETMATAFAMPGGILLMVWMIMYTNKLLKLSR